MDNNSIADNFSLLSKLMDIHGDNSFKSKSYSVAAYTIEKLPTELTELPAAKIFSIKGIGDTIGKKVIEQIETGQLSSLNEYLQKTPPGILEMLAIKGIGPKKISTIWKELEIETLGELLYACNENRLTLYKGFGEKTQQNIKESIEFYMGSLGSFLFQQVEDEEYDFWSFDFEIQHTSVFDDGIHELGALDTDCDRIPMILCGTEWDKLPNFLDTSDELRNIYFKVIT